MPTEENCGNCLFWDHRIEAEVDPHMGYCSVHEMMRADTSHCSDYQRRTPAAERRLMDQLYSDGMDHGNADLGGP